MSESPNGASQPMDTTSSFNAISINGASEALDHGLTAGDREAIGALPENCALLIVRKGPNQGARFLLDADVTTIGRNSRSDVFLDDVTVSRKHARIERKDGHFTLRDAGSLNGTYVNRVLTDAVELVNGAELQIGKYRLSFHTGS